MSVVKTNNPGERKYVDIVNHLHEMYFRYRQKRFQQEMNPSFSGVRWYLGMKEKMALWYCGHCIDLQPGPGESIHQGVKLLGLPVYWVQADSHVALVKTV